MSGSTVDLTACDREPIHHIGTIQPHGVLIAVDAVTATIRYASENAESLLGHPADGLLGAPLTDAIGADNAAALRGRSLDANGPHTLRPWFITIDTAGQHPQALECLAHRNDGMIVLECLKQETEPAALWEEEALRQRVVGELVKPDALDVLTQASAQLLREVTGFDRVMIYRFAEDKHGEVIAESTERPDRFLGLHYPASDIPDPARRHFIQNVIRSIPDIRCQHVPVLTADGTVADAGSAAPLDLTYAMLRGVAPVHVEYLTNMGVRASLSISLVTDEGLWGLVACHHYAPRYLSSSRLRFAELLGSTISALLRSIENTEQLRRSIDAEKTAFAIEQSALGGDALREAVAARAGTLMDLVDAQGLVLSLEGQTKGFGALPEPLPDFAALRSGVEDGVAMTSALSALAPLSADQSRMAAGAAYLSLSEDDRDCLILLRQEFEQSIKWAGRPDKVETRLEDGRIRLSPRGSFALWREERKGTSRPFGDRDREVLRIVRRALFAVNSGARARAALKAQREAEAERARLRHTLLEASRTSSLGELASALAHELNQPLAAVANYVNACRQELRNAGVEIPERAGDLIDDAILESARAGDLVRRMRDFIAGGELEREYIDLGTVIRNSVDLALAFDKTEAPRVEIDIAADLPPVWADPVQIGQVILNLTKNSLAALEGMTPRLLTIRAARQNGAAEISVRDSGRGIPGYLENRLFEPFHASTTRGMGIGLSLCRSIIEAHDGRIWARRLPRGTEIAFSLPLGEGGNSDGES